ncbi:Dam family site-specific DNA-(adenine-N6)-methyltransferase [Thermoanaerobacterium sp. R66]|uniref:DNA adenine methylase n=1 Tax=Thermoanaerobacterium sp. R66 TaxID=2742479 RepID=UPI0023801FB8|nr:Dam family site-specific DNA-(adenine-N6)-methyltransferase [Thermoanaerobacterium sp. R66]MDE4542155.1 Dam family site-specific DNA-(adenine-N6)-methyltransferase [Thermoanaerobacterium sp. R66]
MNEQVLINGFEDKKYSKISAKPFLKWAGGKTQLLNELNSRLPLQIMQKHEIESYIEPFVGGGAFFFFLKNNYNVKETFLIDSNKELIVGYKAIQNNVEDLIFELEDIESRYLKLSDEERKEFYYNVREEYNTQKDTFNYFMYNSDWIKRASYLIFLNKTCFNGLYRLNKNGDFNVPFGKYSKPKICDKENLYEVNKALINTEIICADFEESKKFIKKSSLVYLDPPYRPLSSTSNFTSYNELGFDDGDQVRLSEYFKEMDKKGAYLILSNSDPKNIDKDDDFFDKLYEEFIIERVSAKRYINSKGNGRGPINELIIRNYR